MATIKPDDYIVFTRAGVSRGHQPRSALPDFEPLFSVPRRVTNGVIQPRRAEMHFTMQLADGEQVDVKVTKAEEIPAWVDRVYVRFEDDAKESKKRPAGGDATKAACCDNSASSDSSDSDDDDTDADMAAAVGDVTLVEAACSDDSHVICDGCQRALQPTEWRYKCVVCADFDLCAACEAAQRHAEHPMLRVSGEARDVLRRAGVRRALGRIGKRLRRMGGAESATDAAEAATAAATAAAAGPGGRRHGHRHHRGHHPHHHRHGRHHRHHPHAHGPPHGHPAGFPAHLPFPPPTWFPPQPSCHGFAGSSEHQRHSRRHPTPVACRVFGEQLRTLAEGSVPIAQNIARMMAQTVSGVAQQQQQQQQTNQEQSPPQQQQQQKQESSATADANSTTAASGPMSPQEVYTQIAQDAARNAGFVADLVNNFIFGTAPAPPAATSATGAATTQPAANATNAANAAGAAAFAAASAAAASAAAASAAAADVEMQNAEENSGAADTPPAAATSAPVSVTSSGPSSSASSLAADPPAQSEPQPASAAPAARPAEPGWTVVEPPTAATATAQTPASPSAHPYERQVETLTAMGFRDDGLARALLRIHNGDLDKVVEFLVSRR